MSSGPATPILERMLRSGGGLSAGSWQWGKRAAPAPWVALTERDLRLMALLHDVNFLSASQLLVLGWGEQAGRVGQRRLALLHDSGYVDRFRPVRAAGRAEWNYRLTALGWSALIETGSAPREASYTPAVVTSIAYTEHDLQLAAVVLHIALLATVEEGAGLIDRMPFAWRGPRSGRIDPVDTAESEPSQAARLPPGVRLRAERSRAGYLEPDATLIGQASAGSWAVLIEYDRTERPHKQIDRLHRYDHWLLDGWRRGLCASHASAPVVMFMTSRERPLRRLIETADQTFSAWYGQEHAGPLEGVHPARQRVLFTSRERILAGDWTVQRTPGLPPGLREEPSVCTPGSLAFDLPALFAGSGDRFDVCGALA